MSSLAELKTAAIADGVIDADEAAALRVAIYADGTVDREEADALFEINNVVSGKANAPEWGKLFVDGISDHVLKDEATPGVVDEDEGNYLKAKIEGDGQVDDVEKALLANLRANAKAPIPGSLASLFQAHL